MKILLVLVSLILSFCIIWVITIPLYNILIKIFKKYKNTYLIIVILFFCYLIIIYSPIILITKYYPKDPEKIRNDNINRLVKSAEYYRDIENYKLAYEKYDSAELFSTNKFNFHFEKSKMKYRNNEIDDALIILNILINYNESKNIYKEKYYEHRSLYYYDLGFVKNAINDIEICIRHSKYLDVNIIFQTSILHLLSNNIDSSNYYLIKSESLLHDLEENDFESATKQLNYLRVLIYMRKQEIATACAYRNLYKLKSKARVYCNYSAHSFSSKYKYCKHRYDTLFKDEFDKIEISCK